MAHPYDWARRLAWTVALAVALIPVPARADQWPLPKTEVYYSANHRVRLTVIPRDLESQLAYFEDKTRNKEPAGQQPDSPNKAPQGILEQQDGGGQWSVVWRRALINEVSPVSAVVADQGGYAATFDNWHSMGFGANVVVIYGAGGTLVRAMSLEDFLPRDYIEALPRSVSSLWWSGEHAISAERLILKVVVPSKDDGSDARSYVDVAIELGSGKVLAGDAQWQSALAKASQVAAIRRADEAAWRARQIAPLPAPATADEGDWNGYLAEAFFRLDPEWEDDYPAVKILRAPDAADYKISQTWLRETLLQKDLPVTVVMIASPASPENLIKVLTEIVRESKPKALRKARIYLAVPAAFGGRAAAALAPIGAKIILLDPAKPIPQRKERLPRRDGE